MLLHRLAIISALALALSLVFAVADSHAENIQLLRLFPKYHVCAINIHNDTEMGVFKKLLPPRDFEFHDLTTRAQLASGASPLKLLKQACRQKIKCDVLSISAHFAGYFFGEAGSKESIQQFGKLTTDDIQELMCDPQCSGLFDNLKEVFTFACNTLAGKKRDTRTPQEYLKVLLDIHTPPAEAARIVELRYGSYGPTNQEQIRRLFSKVPMIYGFDAIAPSATTNERFLEAYLKSVPDYSEHLEAVRTPGYLSMIQSELDVINHRTPWKIPLNIPIAEAFSNTTLAQCAGQDAEKASPFGGVAVQVCYLVSSNISQEDKLRRIQTLVESPDFLLHLPAIESFFKKHPPSEYTSAKSKQIYVEIGKSGNARKHLATLIKNLGRGLFKMELLRLGVQMGWVENATFEKEYRAVAKPIEQAYLEILKRPADQSGLDFTVNQLLTGQTTLQAMRKNMEASDENRRRMLFALHNQVEGFPPTPAALTAELASMQKGASLEKIRKELIANKNKKKQK